MFLSYLTHLLQPLDVGVFQPFKHYHSEAVRESVRFGDFEFSKLDFLACFQKIRDQTFKTSTIKSAFAKTGLVPFNPSIVLTKVVAIGNVDKEPVPLPLLSTPKAQVETRPFFQTPSNYQERQEHWAHISQDLDNRTILLSPSFAVRIRKFQKGTEWLLQVVNLQKSNSMLRIRRRLRRRG